MRNGLRTVSRFGSVLVAIAGAGSFAVSDGPEWGRWIPLEDGYRDRIDVRLGRGTTVYARGRRSFHWQLRNRYEVPAAVEIEIVRDDPVRYVRDRRRMEPGSVARDADQYTIVRAIEAVRVHSLALGAVQPAAPNTEPAHE